MPQHERPRRARAPSTRRAPIPRRTHGATAPHRWSPVGCTPNPELLSPGRRSAHGAGPAGMSWTANRCVRPRTTTAASRSQAYRPRRIDLPRRPKATQRSTVRRSLISARPRWSPTFDSDSGRVAVSSPGSSRIASEVPSSGRASALDGERGLRTVGAGRRAGSTEPSASGPMQVHPWSCGPRSKAMLQTPCT